MHAAYTGAGFDYDSVRKKFLKSLSTFLSMHPYLSLAPFFSYLLGPEIGRMALLFVFHDALYERQRGVSIFRLIPEIVWAAYMQNI